MVSLSLSNFYVDFDKIVRNIVFLHNIVSYSSILEHHKNLGFFYGFKSLQNASNILNSNYYSIFVFNYHVPYLIVRKAIEGEPSLYELRQLRDIHLNNNVASIQYYTIFTLVWSQVK